MIQTYLTIYEMLIDSFYRQQKVTRKLLFGRIYRQKKVISVNYRLLQTFRFSTDDKVDIAQYKGLTDHKELAYLSVSCLILPLYF